LKIIVFHDFLIERGGGERVVSKLLTLTREKIIFTSLYLPNQTYEVFEKARIISMDKLFSEIISKNWVLKILFTIFFFRFFIRRFKSFIEKNFDVAIFSGFYSIHLAPFISLPKVYYVHSEPLKHVFKRQSYSVGLFKLLDRLTSWYNKIEVKSLLSIDTIIANSNYTKKLFEDYGVSVKEVIYPPVDTSKFHYKNKKEYFLFVGRLLHHKRPHLLIKVFSKVGREKLVIIGSGPLAKTIKDLSRKFKNIIFLGGVSDKKLREVYSNCKAVIYITEAEPFGIVPIEANASGKPAIVSAEGGLPETIVDKVTGIIVHKNYEENLTRIVRKFENYKFSASRCIKHAKKFDTKEFLKKFKKIIHQIKKVKNNERVL